MNKLVLLMMVLFAACGNPTKMEVYGNADDHKTDDRTLTLILDKEVIHYYQGILQSRDNVKQVPYKDIRPTILEYKKSLGDSLVIVIKPCDNATYKNTVDILDEMTINDVKRYVMVELTNEEVKMLNISSTRSD